MSKFRDRFSNFMSGRYGADDFGRFLNKLVLVLLIVSLFSVLFAPLEIAWPIAIALMIYSYYRMFSKNFGARNRENEWFLRVFKKKKSYGYNGYGNGYSYNSRTMTDKEKKALDKKTHRIFKCPNCTQKIRVPRNKGRICIKCPNCRIEFIKKT